MGTIVPVNAIITADISTIHVENETFRARGRKLSSEENPAKAVLRNVDGSFVKDLNIRVIRKGKAVEVELPSVNIDTKFLLELSGGNVAENNPQQKIIVILDDPSSSAVVSADDIVTGSANSTVGGTIGPEGPQGPQGSRGDPGYVVGPDQDINTLPDFISEDTMSSSDPEFSFRAVRIASRNQEAGEIDIGSFNAFSIVDSDPETVDVIGLIKGTGSKGQRVSFIVDSFFILALSNSLFRSAVTPEQGSIVAPDFFTGPIPARKGPMVPTRVIELPRYQSVPVFPGMVLEFIYDGFQWRLINMPFYYDFCFDCSG